jgi:hypothetical protein
MAFPSLPQLPAVPDLVDPDRWLLVNDGLHLVRLVRSDGTVRVESLELLRGSSSGWPTRGAASVGGPSSLTGRSWPPADQNAAAQRPLGQGLAL